ncbi:hypothetical protein RRG08_011674 [Elysia crispata]|uniref:Uncharacterized protein n=1 Tax=Elysia crispata TaxID=231223 RepID=A0AAE0YK51_9GAST|nr:hypothetical protein RRG08_011674 [Elysia crispata]
MNIDDVESDTVTSWETPNQHRAPDKAQKAINKLKILMNELLSLLVFHDTSETRTTAKYCQGRHKNHFHLFVDVSKSSKKLSALPAYRQCKNACKYGTGGNPVAMLSYQNVRTLAGLLYYLKFDREKTFPGTNNQFLLDYWNDITKNLDVEDVVDIVGDVELDDISFEGLQNMTFEQKMLATTGSSFLQNR